MIRTEADADSLFEWLTQNYEAFADRIPPPFRVFMPYWGSGCSEDRLARVEAFLSQPEREVDGMAEQMAKVAEGVHDCSSLRTREGASVARYLRELAGEE